MATILEATLRDLSRKQKSITRLFPPFPDRVKNVGLRGGVRLASWDEDTWKFKVHSGTKTSLWYDDILQFQDIEQTLIDLIQNTRLWNRDKKSINLQKLGRELLQRGDVKIGCSCPAQLYWGGDFIISLPRYDAKYGDKETRPPRVRNPKKYGAFCKHLQAVFNVLPFYPNSAAKWVREYHGDLLKDTEQGMRKALTTKKQRQMAARSTRAAQKRDAKAFAVSRLPLDRDRKEKETSPEETEES